MRSRCGGSLMWFVLLFASHVMSCDDVVKSLRSASCLAELNGRPSASTGMYPHHITRSRSKSLTPTVDTLSCDAMLCALNSSAQDATCAVPYSGQEAIESSCRLDLNRSARFFNGSFAYWGASITTSTLLPPVSVSCISTAGSMTKASRCLSSLPCRVSATPDTMSSYCSASCMAQSMICILSFFCSNAPVDVSLWLGTGDCAPLIPAQWLLCAAYLNASMGPVVTTQSLSAMCQDAVALVPSFSVADSEGGLKKYEAFVIAGGCLVGMLLALGLMCVVLVVRRRWRAHSERRDTSATVVPQHGDGISGHRLAMREVRYNVDEEEELWHDDPPTIVGGIPPSTNEKAVWGRPFALDDWAAGRESPGRFRSAEIGDDWFHDRSTLGNKKSTENPAAIFFEDDDGDEAGGAWQQGVASTRVSSAATRSDEPDDGLARVIMPVFAESKKGRQKMDNSELSKKKWGQGGINDARSASHILRDIQFDETDVMLPQVHLVRHAMVNAVVPFDLADGGDDGLLGLEGASRPTSPSSQSSEASCNNFGDDYWDEEAETLAAQALQMHPRNIVNAAAATSRLIESPPVPESVCVPASDVMSRKDIVLLITTGQFVRGRLLGRGAMGSVYQAVARNIPALAAPVCIALKEIDVQRCTRDELGKMIARFNYLCRISHRHVAEIYLVRYDAMSLALHVWMEFVAGPTLQAYAGRFRSYPPTEVCSTTTPARAGSVVEEGLSVTVRHCPTAAPPEVADRRDVPEQQAIKWLGQVLSAVSHLHKKGIIHRDIKGANVLLSADLRHVKIIDLDCCFIFPVTSSRSGGRNGGISSDLASFLSASPASVVGSPLWMPPETLSSVAPPSPATDLWSIGIMLAELLMGGQLPWPQFDSTLAGIHYIIHTPYPSLRRATVSDRCKDFLGICWSVDPQRRNSSMELRSHPWLQRSRPSSFRTGGSRSTEGAVDSHELGSSQSLAAQLPPLAPPMAAGAAAVDDLEAEIKRLEAELDAM